MARASHDYNAIPCTPSYTPLQEWDGGGIHAGRGFQAQVDVGAWIQGQTIVLDFGAPNKVRSLHAVYLAYP